MDNPKILDYEAWCAANGYKPDGIAGHALAVDMLLTNYPASRQRFGEQLRRFTDTVQNQGNSIDNLHQKMLGVFLVNRGFVDSEPPQGTLIKPPQLTVEEQLTLSYVLLATIHDTMEYFAPIASAQVVQPHSFMPTAWSKNGIVTYHTSPHLETVIKAALARIEADLKFPKSTNAGNGKISLLDWAGGKRVTLAIVFTDIIGSTALSEEIGDEGMDNLLRAHFAQSRKLIEKFQGREIKTNGDGFMVVFKSVDLALDYAQALQEDTCHPQVRIRAGIHIGSMDVDAEKNDVSGRTVNFAKRVVEAIKDKGEIWLSEQAKMDIDQLGAQKHKCLQWEKHDEVSIKGFAGQFVLWSLTT